MNALPDPSHAVALPDLEIETLHAGTSQVFIKWCGPEKTALSVERSYSSTSGLLLKASTIGGTR